MPDTPATSVPWIVPTITALLGYLFAVVGEWARDARTHKREREARKEARDDARTERRTGFQRQALVDLQDAISALAQTVLESHARRAAKAAGGARWEDAAPPGEVSLKALESRYDLVKLRARVRDEDVRDRADALLTATFEVLTASNEAEGVAAIRKVTASMDEANERIGAVLRSLDDIEAPHFEDAESGKLK
jgi:hypothetical protein